MIEPADFPPLPEGFGVQWTPNPDSADVVYTADDMRSYATQAVREAVERERAKHEPVWCGCGDAIMPNTGAKCWVCASLEDADDARQEEREACAKLAESDEFYGSATQHAIAAAIRARAVRDDVQG